MMDCYGRNDNVKTPGEIYIYDQYDTWLMLVKYDVIYPGYGLL